ncbi:MAG: CoA transferase [Actinobacteria bacterium]|nr:CoA transferase [Actinomycetota bacterium]
MAADSRVSQAGGLLAGMRVLDASPYRPMPHATQVLADLGAEVLKLEPPGGDPMRVYPELFAAIARGKRSIVLDLRTDDGRRRALELAAQADVVCEAWRPDVASRLGLGYDAVAAVNPSVIYCSLTGYGQTGPWRDVPGHDVNYQALAGALAPPRPPQREPSVPRLPAADLEGGTMCALLVCAAWARRLVTGEGERIDVAMTDVVSWWVGAHSGTAHVDSAEATRGSPGYGVFATRDGRWVAIGVLGEERLWRSICAALELDDLAAADFATRLAMVDVVNARVAAAIAARDADDVTERLLAHGAPVSPVLTPEEATRHEQLVARGLFLETTRGLVPDLPALLSRNPRRSATAIPDVNQHPEGFTPPVTHG